MKIQKTSFVAKTVDEQVDVLAQNQDEQLLSSSSNERIIHDLYRVYDHASYSNQLERSLERVGQHLKEYETQRENVGAGERHTSQRLGRTLADSQLTRKLKRPKIVFSSRQSSHAHLTTLAAVLVIGALVVTGLLLFQSQTPSTARHPTPPIGPLGKPITVQTQANGLEATMRVTPGPYFLSEMLEVDLWVTNHSHNTLVVTFLPEKSCTSELPALLTVMMTGGSGPSDKALQHNLADNLCPSLLGFPGQLFPPNQTMHMLSKYVVLTNSGHITLTAQIGLAKQVPGQSNSYGSLPRSLPNSDPLAGHWPSLQINVQARIPADRLITGQQKGTQVTIEAPPLVRSQLLYISILRCDLGVVGPNQNKLTTLILHQPPCDDSMYGNPPNRFIKWTYIVYAVGYAVFSGSTQK